MTDVDIEAIRARNDARTPGGWHWSGNTDYSDPTLSAWCPGAGRVSVVDHVKVDRLKDDRSANEIREYCAESGMSESETDEQLQSYLYDDYGQERHDERLAFNVDGFLIEARTLAIYEVAPNATSRNDPAVYRADIDGVRHPDAEFIVNAPQDITDLLALVEQQQQRIAELEAQISGTYAVADLFEDVGIDPFGDET